MSPIIDIQRRGHQIGEIRLGKRVATGKGKFRPEMLEAFRFTTQSAQIAEAVAHLLGGQAREQELATGKKTYDVETDATTLPVMVPPGDAAISQWYEMWSAAGCQRRCDGETETLKQQPCVCPADKDRHSELAKQGSACKPITRLNVMLPDLPDLGVWLLSSTGWNAATELGGAAEVLATARDRGVIIPATLRLEQRETRKVGEATKKYAVPVLEINATLRQMTELASGQAIADSLPPEPANARHAISAASRASSQPHALESARDVAPIEAELVGDAPDGLDEEHAAELQRRIEKANFREPYIPAMEEQIKRWTDELLADQDKGKPF